MCSSFVISEYKINATQIHVDVKPYYIFNLLSNKLPRLDYLPDFTGLLYKQKTKEMNRIY